MEIFFLHLQANKRNFSNGSSHPTVQLAAVVEVVLQPVSAKMMSPTSWTFSVSPITPGHVQTPAVVQQPSVFQRQRNALRLPESKTVLQAYKKSKITTRTTTTKITTKTRITRTIRRR